MAMEAAFLQMQAQIAELQQQLMAANARELGTDRLAKAMEEHFRPPERQEKSLVDTRGIAKPNSFGGGDAKNLERMFPSWARKTSNYIVSVFPALADVLLWAVDQPTVITQVALNTEHGLEEGLGGVANLKELDHQVYSALLHLTEGDANDLVCNSDHCGAEAWRKLHRRFDPLTGGRIRNLLRSLISPQRCTKAEDLPATLERWEEQCGRYSRTKGPDGQRRTLAEDVKMAALESLVPVELEQHLQLNASKFDSYDAMRQEATRYVETQIGMKMSEPRIDRHDKRRDDPMDTSSLLPGAGAGGAQRFAGKCLNCDKTGHRAADCRAKGGGKSKGKDKGSSGGGGFYGFKGNDKGKGKGKGFKGKGKGKGHKAAGSLEDDAKDGEEEAWYAEAGAEEEQWEPEAGSIELACLDISSADLNGFKLASGEIIEDEGPYEIKGTLENGMKVSIAGRRAQVHKALVSASKLAEKGNFIILHARGGHVVSRDTKLGKDLGNMVKKLDVDPMLTTTKVYQEAGVYNFYLNTNDGWLKMNLDSGAAETVVNPDKLEPLGGRGLAQR